MIYSHHSQTWHTRTPFGLIPWPTNFPLRIPILWSCSGSFDFGTQSAPSEMAGPLNAQQLLQYRTLPGDTVIPIASTSLC